MPLKNELYNIGFSQDYYFPNISPLFVSELYLNTEGLLMDLCQKSLIPSS